MATAFCFTCDYFYTRMFLVSRLIKNAMQYTWLTSYQSIICSSKFILVLCFAVLAIVLVGLLYGFFIAIICGQRINERHYHVLAKQELTKVCYLILFFFSFLREVCYLILDSHTSLSYNFYQNCLVQWIVSPEKTDITWLWLSR